jgi:hypothetical protein
LLTRRDFTRILPARASAITGVAWLGARRVVAVVRARVPPLGYAYFVAVLDGKRLVGTTLHSFGRVPRVEASPRAGFFSISIGGDLWAVRTRGGQPIYFPPLLDARALAWSPDERWTVVATHGSVYVFLTNTGEARVRRLPIVARDLAWR